MPVPTHIKRLKNHINKCDLFKPFLVGGIRYVLLFCGGGVGQHSSHTLACGSSENL